MGAVRCMALAGERIMKREHTKSFTVSFTAHCEEQVTKAELLAFVRDLEWSGGCRDPQNDPLFSSITMTKIVVKRDAVQRA